MVLLSSVAKPKSHSFTVEEDERRMLAGFRSRWRIGRFIVVVVVVVVEVMFWVVIVVVVEGSVGWEIGSELTSVVVVAVGVTVAVAVAVAGAVVVDCVVCRWHSFRLEVIWPSTFQMNCSDM